MKGSSTTFLTDLAIRGNFILHFQLPDDLIDSIERRNQKKKEMEKELEKIVSFDNPLKIYILTYLLLLNTKRTERKEEEEEEILLRPK